MRERTRRTRDLVSATETHMLIESLQVGGWPLRWIEQECGLPDRILSRMLHKDRVHIEQRDAVRLAFLKLRKVSPPYETHEQKTAVARAIRDGKKNGGVHPDNLKVGGLDAA